MYDNQQLKPSEATSELMKLEKALENFLKVVGDSIDNIIRVEDDPNEVFLRSQMYVITDRLDDTLSDIKYLKRDVSAEGNLYLNEQGRYEIDYYTYLTSGNVCELLVDDKFDGYGWVKTSIEHDGEHGYYATALGRNVSIDGLRARVRRN